MKGSDTDESFSFTKANESTLVDKGHDKSARNNDNPANAKTTTIKQDKMNDSSNSSSNSSGSSSSDSNSSSSRASNEDKV